MFFFLLGWVYTWDVEVSPIIGFMNGISDWKTKIFVILLVGLYGLSYFPELVSAVELSEWGGNQRWHWEIPKLNGGLAGKFIELLLVDFALLFVIRIRPWEM